MENCESLSRFLVDSALKGTLLLVIAWIVTRSLRFGSAAVRHRIWSMTMVGLIVLPIATNLIPPWRIAILPATNRMQSRDSNLNDSTNPIPLTPQTSSSPLTGTVPPIKRPHAVGDSQRAATPSTWPQSSGSKESIRWSAIAVVCIWLLGVFVSVLSLVVGFRRNRAMLDGSIPLENVKLLQLVDQLRRQIGLDIPVQARLSAHSVVPQTYGFLRSSILLSRQASHWPESTQRSVLLHELVHILRRDVAQQFIGRIACSVYWFHPVAWFALHQLRLEREFACDDAVVLSGECASDYAEKLVEIARAYHHPGRLTIAVAMAQQSGLEKRLNSLFDSRVSHRPIGLRTTLSSAAIAGMLLMAIAVIRLIPMTSRVMADDSPSAEPIKIVTANTKVRLMENASKELEFSERVKAVEGFDARAVLVTAIAPDRLRIKGLNKDLTTLEITGESWKKYQVRVNVVADAGPVRPAADKSPKLDKPVENDVAGVQTDAILSIDLSADGSQIVGGGFGNLVRVWDTRSAELIHRFDVPTATVRAVACHPKSSVIVGSVNNNVQAWDLQSGRPLRTFQGSPGECGPLVFSQDGKLLAGHALEFGKERPTSAVCVWNFETAELVQKIENGTALGRGLAFSPDGNWLAAPYFTITLQSHSRPIKDSEREAGIRFWSTETWKSKSFNNDRGSTYTVDFSPDGTLVAGGGGYFANDENRAEKGLTSEVIIWDFHSGQVKQRLTRDEKAGSVHARFSPDGKRVAGQHYGRVFKYPHETRVLSEVTLWDVESGDELWTVADAHAPDPQPPVFSRDGKYIYTRDDKAIRKLDASDGETIDFVAEAKPISN